MAVPTFVDRVILRVSAGRGGHGVASVHREKFKPLGGPDGGNGRRRQPRAALRLELELLDGTHVAVQVEPVPGGVAIELAAPDGAALARLRALQPQLDAAVERAGLVVVRWSFKAGIAAAGSAPALLAAEDVADVLTLPVFRAVAELALVLPAQG